jgi:hypothetical protein
MEPEGSLPYQLNTSNNNNIYILCTSVLPEDGYKQQPKHAYTTYEDRSERMFRNVDTKFRCRGITQKKEYNIQNMAKV